MKHGLVRYVLVALCVGVLTAAVRTRSVIARGHAAASQSPRGFIPGVPTVLPGALKLLKVIPIPGLPVASVDILWADQASERLYLSDRSNASIDIFDGENDVFV